MDDKEMFLMNKVITLTLIKIGIRCDLIGFSYLCSAIKLAILNPHMLRKICKNLYVAVGQEHNVEKTNNVERSMRHAIDNAFVNQNFSEINKMFNTILYNADEKPTVGELITLVSDFYTLGLYKNYITI